MKDACSRLFSCPDMTAEERTSIVYLFTGKQKIGKPKRKEVSQKMKTSTKNLTTQKKNSFVRALALLLTALLLVTVLPLGVMAEEAADTAPTIQTTLRDGTIQKGSKKAFDVWAKDAAGNKIAATVTLNGNKLSPTWDDSAKTSYTLSFTQSNIGENTVKISAEADGKTTELTYTINYVGAKEGDSIGYAYLSVELFTIGCSYLVKPTRVEIFEGETSAEVLLRVLSESGYCAYYGGTPKSGFYMGYVSDGDNAETRYSGYTGSGISKNPKKLELDPKIPEYLESHVENYIDVDDFTKNFEGYLGEFDISFMSGWMYAVNNVAPNVGMADYYLGDGDVMRVQFTLAYGLDIGASESMGGFMGPNYYDVANRDALTKTIAGVASGFLDGSEENAEIAKAYADAIAMAETLNAPQDKINAANAALTNAVEARKAALVGTGDDTVIAAITFAVSATLLTVITVSFVIEKKKAGKNS